MRKIQRHNSRALILSGASLTGLRLRGSVSAQAVEAQLTAGQIVAFIHWFGFFTQDGAYEAAARIYQDARFTFFDADAVSTFSLQFPALAGDIF